MAFRYDPAGLCYFQASNSKEAVTLPEMSVMERAVTETSRKVLVVRRVVAHWGFRTLVTHVRRYEQGSVTKLGHLSRHWSLSAFHVTIGRGDIISKLHVA